MNDDIKVTHQSMQADAKRNRQTFVLALLTVAAMFGVILLILNYLGCTPGICH